eukprot:TRINITY_DN18908_c0_g2_i1.p1 TRINITY_DN18908_c0_g2~~TRINITY_DN18908_c0_g2_i1.p1  ORF type:complete len:176 (+),score=60.05 TRINITY_DN18908_c0_g2_i1:81-608(+)
MVGVRAKKTRRTRTVKITGRNKKKLDKGQRCDPSNPLGNLIKKSLRKKDAIPRAYARHGVAGTHEITQDDKARLEAEVPERQELEVPEPQPPKGPKITDLEHAWVLALVEKHGADFRAMARDRKGNPMQYTARQMRRRVVRLVKHERHLFPEDFRDEVLGDVRAAVPAVSSDDEW